MRGTLSIGSYELPVWHVVGFGASQVEKEYEKFFKNYVRSKENNSPRATILIPKQPSTSCHVNDKMS